MITTSYHHGHLSIVGAGPGDPDLITVKAIKALKKADVVLYDALLSTDLLDYTSESCEKIFVGKRKGCYAYQQNQINELIVDLASQGKRVVRLKGGDPFIFGRGSEEINYAASHGIQTEMIPGISSCMAVPGLQGIPLTARNKAESFWVITGTTKDHKLSDDVRLAVQSTATVVILMGMSKLAQIMDLFSTGGKGNVPVAIIQSGSTPEEKIAIGTVDSIVSKVEQLGLANPAIIVIGEVVAVRQELQNLQASYSNQYNVV